MLHLHLGQPRPPGAPGTLGYPQPGRRIAILTPEGAKVPTGETGILAIHRGDPGLMLGYLGPDGPRPAADRRLVLTGDLVSQDPVARCTTTGGATT
jgi:acyl-coenzyme A synthetase/AMP-(fatty) acid ligase